MDKLLWQLETLGFEIIAYADDLVITVSGKHELKISERIQEALNVTWDCCREEGLSISLEKTVLLSFTSSERVNLKLPTLNGVELRFSTETKYLGVILDSKLTWNAHLKKVKQKAINKPGMLLWLYKTVIRPMIVYD